MIPEIKQLKEILKKIKEHHENASNIYGSELCSGEMQRKEKILETKIKELENKTESLVTEIENFQQFRIQQNIPEKTKSPIDWDQIAENLVNKYGECTIDEGDQNNPYDYWLQDVTVADMIEFFKFHLNKTKKDIEQKLDGMGLNGKYITDKLYQ